MNVMNQIAAMVGLANSPLQMPREASMVGQLKAALAQKGTTWCGRRDIHQQHQRVEAFVRQAAGEGDKQNRSRAPKSSNVLRRCRRTWNAAGKAQALQRAVGKGALPKCVLEGTALSAAGGVA